ncbi:hypothetical protein SEMRO_100_G051320.1 [Seminavis robusta]|uniref:Uncharacterized protein n=1 Tax=Seminavis robusta TaxID=568900 RepID=A0A9N8DE57_9STRA|nr:hypothetical protein SEMRO_100_G051320.1 [Seminavis robusta]|eukprot:Sro100_g051320.1 n/a (239) ;mRNA; f:75265-76144
MTATTKHKMMMRWIIPQNRGPDPPASFGRHIEELFDNIDTCIAFSVEGGDVISDRNTVSAGIATLQATGLFIHPIREWKKRLHQENRNLTHFKEFFRDAENVRQTETTVTAAGYHQRANATIPDTQTVTTGTPTLTHPQMIDIATITGIVQESLRESQAANATPTTTDCANRTLVPELFTEPTRCMGFGAGSVTANTQATTVIRATSPRRATTSRPPHKTNGGERTIQPPEMISGKLT